MGGCPTCVFQLTGEILGMTTTTEYGSIVETHDENQRSQKRESLIYYLRVHQYATREYFGRVVDMPERFSSDGNLRLPVVSKWCNPDVNTEYFIAGFAFQEISSDTRATVSKLLNLYSLSRSIKGF